MGVRSGGTGVCGLSWIFIHGTDIVDSGLKVLFFGLFCYFSLFFSVAPLRRGLIVLFFSPFFFVALVETVRTFFGQAAGFPILGGIFPQ